MNKDHNISWEEEFDEQFVSRRDTYDRAEVKDGVMKPTGYIEIWNRKPSPTTIKSFIRTLLSHQKSEIYREVEKLPTYEHIRGDEESDLLIWRNEVLALLSEDKQQNQ